MDSRYIALAIPFFFLLIFVELWWNKAHGDIKYRLHDSIGSLSCGIGNQAFDVLGKTLTMVGYVYLFAHFSIHQFALSSVAAWLGIMVLLDLLYYVFHRASHRVNFLWAMHAVHHQSEEYNLSTALRQSWLDPFAEWTFYLPLAVVGFPPAMYAGALSLNRIYQFWIHTRAIKRLGPVERVLNTPSHHRVHHGINPRFIDKNYAGIFIVWDQLFGTFTDEGDVEKDGEPTYGTVKPVATFDALWANLAEWARIVSLARGATTLREKIWAWFAPPEWRPLALGGVVTVPEVDRATYRKFDREIARGLTAYVLVQLVIVVALQSALLLVADKLSPLWLALGVGGILATIASWGGLLQGRRFAVELEWLRLAALAALALGVLGPKWGAWGWVAGASAVLPALAFAVWVARYRRAEVRSAGAADTARRATA